MLVQLNTGPGGSLGAQTGPAQISLYPLPTRPQIKPIYRDRSGICSWLILPLSLTSCVLPH